MSRGLLILSGYLSIYRDLVASRASRLVASGLTTFARKLALLASSIVAVAIFASLGWPTVAGLAGIPALILIAWHARGEINRRRMVSAIVQSEPDLTRVPHAYVTLAKMGLAEHAVSALLERAGSGEEVRLAELDQNNRVLSEVGDIDLFRGHLIAAEEFRARSRNEVQIVIRAGVVAVRKCYGHRTPFTNELIALHALRGLDGIPRLVGADAHSRTIYQSFIAGKNLGSLLAEGGTSVSAQHRLVRDYRAHPNWKEASASLAERERALDDLRATVAEGFVERLGKLFLNVQAAGVVLSDIKYGNVLLLDGRPHLCDFDFSRYYPASGTRFYLERDRSRDHFNYIFGTELATERDLRSALTSLSERQPDLTGHGIYFGEGRRFGRLLSADSATRRWLRLRRHLPALRGKDVLALGSADGLVALLMLRAGARAATAYEPHPGIAELTVLCQRFVELIDNRRYDLDIIQGEPAPPPIEVAAPNTIILTRDTDPRHEPDGAAESRKRTRTVGGDVEDALR